MSLSRHISATRLCEKTQASLDKHRSGTRESHSLAHASRFAAAPVPKYELPKESIPARFAYQLIKDELSLDANVTLNMATFLTSWMEPEAVQLMQENRNKNFADMNCYPQTWELQNRCISMLAKLWNIPEDCEAVGTATIGSSEAFMLSALALKLQWRNRRKKEDKPYDKPNMVMGNNAQVALEKFCKYFDVEMRLIPVSKESNYALDVRKVPEYVDENTIGVVGILGSTYTGHFEPIQELSDVLDQIQREKGIDVPIHVDAASGGFVAPFVFPDYVWDFRLRRVKSINVSGHKYGLVYPGIGWAIWRNKTDLPEEVIFHIDYLGGDEPTFTLNFSRNAETVIAQYYNFVRLGFQGYKDVIQNCLDNARFLSRCLEDSGYFEVLSAAHREDQCAIPVVTVCLKNEGSLKNRTFNEKDIMDRLRRRGWLVPAYNLPPAVHEQLILRVVIRETHSEDMMEELVKDMISAVEYLMDKDGEWNERMKDVLTHHGVEAKGWTLSTDKQHEQDEESQTKDREKHHPHRSFGGRARQHARSGPKPTFSQIC
eukprot:GILJ01012742.1.p1 GENE.GILJ01012742.1~~GILJ01012742.1.p1  ORF type:complete len:544 (-),score=73.36 GILJ01012742.1:93-1724(-)